MNSAKMQVVDGLNGIARKVYDMMPIDQPVTVHDMLHVMAKTGSRPEFRTVTACLASFHDKGIAAESGGQYRRLPIKQRIAMPQIDVRAPRAEDKPQERTPLERLADLEQRVRLMAQELLSIAKELSDASLDMVSKVESGSKVKENLARLLASLNE